MRWLQAFVEVQNVREPPVQFQSVITNHNSTEYFVSDARVSYATRKAGGRNRII